MSSNPVLLPSSGSAGPLRGTEAEAGRGNPVQRVLPAIGLFLVAPLVAEFLLGNMSITHLGLLGMLAPLYGGGALLIREAVRRAGRGWTSIFLLALAYGVLEEAFLTESIFNPDYLGLKLHLLQPAFVPLLGIGAWYTVFVLTLHTVWSISVPIALIEALAPNRAGSPCAGSPCAGCPWMGRWGVAIVATLFMLACFAMGSFSIWSDANHFVASHAQFGCSAMVILALVALAFSFPQRLAIKTSGWVPNPWAAGIGSFALTLAFLLIPREWGWWAVFAYGLLDGLAILPIRVWSRRFAWSGLRTLGLAGGAAMAYGAHAFYQVPSLGNVGLTTRLGNLVFFILAASLVGVAAAKSKGHRAAATQGS